MFPSDVTNSNNVSRNSENNVEVRRNFDPSRNNPSDRNNERNDGIEVEGRSTSNISGVSAVSGVSGVSGSSGSHNRNNSDAASHSNRNNSLTSASGYSDRGGPEWRDNEGSGRADGTSDGRGEYRGYEGRGEVRGDGREGSERSGSYSGTRTYQHEDSKDSFEDSSRDILRDHSSREILREHSSREILRGNSSKEYSNNFSSVEYSVREPLSESCVEADVGTESDFNFHLTEGQSRRGLMADCESECSRIFDFLYVGGIEIAKSRRTLEAHNITRIINCSAAVVDNYFINDPRVTYLCLNMVDGRQDDISWFLGDVLQFIMSGKRNGENILLHCERGVSRSCSFAIAWHIWTTGESDDDLNHKKELL